MTLPVAPLGFAGTNIPAGVCSSLRSTSAVGVTRPTMERITP
jgi:hypothetical protein